jgi:hypothetical protein
VERSCSLYVELRTPERVSAPTVTRLGCVEVVLDRPAAPGVPLRPVLGLDLSRVSRKLGVDAARFLPEAGDCPVASQRQASFLID